MTTSGRRGGTAPVWICSWCHGGAEDEQSLLDHQEWCLRDPEANTQLLSAVAERDGELVGFLDVISVLPVVGASAPPHIASTFE